MKNTDSAAQDRDAWMKTRDLCFNETENAALLQFGLPIATSNVWNS